MDSTDLMRSAALDALERLHAVTWQMDIESFYAPLSETLDEANGEAYTVDVKGTFAACYALDAKAKDMPSGMLYTVRKR